MVFNLQSVSLSLLTVVPLTPELLSQLMAALGQSKVLNLQSVFPGFFDSCARDPIEMLSLLVAAIWQSKVLYLV